MRRRILLLASAAMLVAFAGCRHKCHKLKDDCCSAPPIAGGRSPILLPPAGVPTTPTPFPPPASPGPSNFPPPADVKPKSGPDVLFPDPLPSGMSMRPSGVIGAPARATTEPPKAPTGLPAYTKVKDGLFAGGKPTLDGFDALRKSGFRAVIYLHAAGADVSAIKDMATTRDLNFIEIEAAPEALADAVKEFNRAAADKINHPAYVFADDAARAGAVWYLHFRTVDAHGDDVARLRAKSLGLSEQGEEGKAFALAIQRALKTK